MPAIAGGLLSCPTRASAGADRHRRICAPLEGRSVEVALIGDLIALVTLAVTLDPAPVALLTSLVTLDTSPVALLAGQVALVADCVALVAGVVALVPDLIAKITGLITLVPGIITPNPRLVAPIGRLIALVPGVIPALSNRIAGWADISRIAVTRHQRAFDPTKTLSAERSSGQTCHEDTTGSHLRMHTIELPGFASDNTRRRAERDRDHSAPMASPASTAKISSPPIGEPRSRGAASRLPRPAVHHQHQGRRTLGSLACTLLGSSTPRPFNLAAD